MTDPRTWEHYLTVSELRKALADLPDEAPVFYQRIEDLYFEQHGWAANVVEKPNDMWPDQQDQYIRAFCVVRYADEPTLFITAHY